jgi:hypothetical protein
LTIVHDYVLNKYGPPNVQGRFALGDCAGYL